MKKITKEIISWLLIFVIAFGLSKVINMFVLYNISSPTGSMENTFMINEKVAVFRLAYLFGKPQRGDIVVFPAPDNPEEDYIKRIIGLPGETLEVIDGVVYINGKALKEDYLKEKPIGSFGPYKVPKNSYFMMGDNRNISLDARYWEHKFVTLDKIKGKALYKYPHFKWLYKKRYAS
jgi:signal peptidase I, bacterial type